ncbi:MAG: efflux RND transporter periplasmic adaptor subunit [Fusicatenibacter sp.]
MKKKTIAAICAAAVLAAAGGGAAWYFPGNGAGDDDENVVYVNTVESLMNIGVGNGMENRYAGVVEAQNAWKVEKNMEKTVKEILVEVGQEVQVGTPLFIYDTEKFTSDLEQAQLDLERINNEISSMNTNINQLYKDKKSAAKDQQASLTLQIQEAELELKRKEYEGKSKQSEIDKLKENITNSTVISEIAGVVKSINTDDSSSGGYYNDNSDNSFITVLATGDFQVKGKINEQNLYDGSIMEGSRVIIHSRVDENQTWTGTVTKVDLDNAESNNNNYYYSSDSMSQSSSYPFYVELDYTSGLILGQHVYIEPDVGQQEEKTGVWLAEYFINDPDSNPYVWTDNGKGKLEKRSVTLGEYDENMMEYQITDGLAPEDAITFPEEGLEPGMTTVVSTDGMMGQSNPAMPDEMMEDGMMEDGMIEDGMTEDAGSEVAEP